MRIVTFVEEAPWIEAALGELRAAVDRARGEGRSSIALCLAGGRTPEVVYRAMAALPLEGVAAELWLGDERAVPPESPDRNGAMVERAFAACAWDPRPRLRPWPFAAVEAAAALYGDQLRSSLGPEPAFDLALLGLGADGHTASIFPGAEVARGERGALTVVTRSPLPPHTRMSLTLGALRAARRRLFLARGEDKLDAIRRLEAEDPSIPASALAGEEAVALYLR